MNQTIIMASGGIESTVAAAQALKNGEKIYLIHYDLGRRQDPMELYAVNSFSVRNNVPLKIVKLHAFQEIFSGIIPPPLLLREADEDPTGISISIIPPLTQLSLSFAKQAKAGKLVIGLTAEQFPHGRKKFFDLLGEANDIFQSKLHRVKITLPFEKINKADVIKLGAKLKLDFTNTWSCDNEIIEHCGECSSCIVRKKAFKSAKITDPTIYSK